MKIKWLSGFWLFLFLGTQLAIGIPGSGGDLGVTVTPYTNQVAKDELAIFTLVLTNSGPASVSGAITVTNTLSAGLEFFNTDGTGTYNASNGTWTVPSLAAGASVKISVYATAIGTGVQSDSAQIGIPVGYADNNAANNSATATVTVAAPVQTHFALSGSVLGCTTNGAGFGLVSLELTGGTNLFTTADNNGMYAFTNVLPGNYTVTPSRTGITFTPPKLTVTLGSNDLTVVPIVASGAGGVIQGRLTYGIGSFPVSDIPVVLFGTPDRTVITDSSGYYMFTNCAPGFYTVAPTPKFGFKPVPSGMTVSLSETNCSVVANFRAQFRMVELVALEVTQVIQDWNNSVPLISGKKTYLRAHLQLTPTSNTLTAVTLKGARVVNPQFPNAPVAPANFGGETTVYTTNAASVRGSWDSTLNFEIPAAWCTGALTLQFSCTNNVTVVAANVVPVDQTVSVEFTPANVLPLKFYAWNIGGAEVDAAAYADLPGRLVSAYPVPDINKDRVILTPPAALVLPAVPTNASDIVKDDWALLNSNAKLSVLQAIDSLLGGRFGGGSNWIYYAALPAPAPGAQGWAKATLTSSNTINPGASPMVASGYVASKFYTFDRHTHSHEIGHNLGRPHDVMADGEGVCEEGAPVGTPVYPLFQAVPSPGPIKPALGPMTSGDNALIYGLDTLTLAGAKMNPVVDPNKYFDLMSYCDVLPLDVWPSSFTYAALRSSISNLVAPPPAPPVAGPIRSWFFVRGYVDYSTGLAGLLPAWSVATTSTNSPPGSPPGSYLVQVFDALHNLLAQIPFAPDSYDVEEEGIPGLKEGEFLVPVPLMPGMHQVQIMNTNSQVIATMTASTNLPGITVVSLTDTNGGAFTGAGPLVVHWTSQDADPNAQLRYSVQYSADGGTNWENLDLDLSGSSYQIDSLYLPASLHALIRVLASDGFNTSASVNSPMFVVPNHPPVVAINSPGNGSLFTLDQQIFFDASVTDPQDGSLDGAQVQWSSSVNGFLGTGALLPCSATNLTEGSHILTVTAMDNEGLSASASTRIFVLRQPQPELSIQTVSNQLRISWLGSITNFALWSSTNLLAGPWTPVATPPVAADSTQTVTVPATNAPQFFELRMK